MKEYQTWELLKMASENQYDNNQDLSERAKYINNENIIVAFGESTSNKGLFILDGRFYRSAFKNETWRLIQQPVTFIEAVQAFSKGKTVRCLHGLNRIYTPKSNMPLFMKDEKENTPSVMEILKGEWFINED